MSLGGRSLSGTDDVTVRVDKIADDGGGPAGRAPSLPRASVRETVAVAAGVFAPMLAQGVIVRRPAMTALADRLQVDRHGAAILRRLRDRHGPGPVLLRIPGRELAVVLDAGDVERLLAGAPHPFTPANREKRTALRHFQPFGVLISDDAGRALRRPWNEEVLDQDAGLHRLHAHLVEVVAEEVADLTDPVLTWDRFHAAFWRVVRRVALGDAARNDERVTELMALLRAQANWAFLRPRSTRRLRELGRLLQGYVADADPLSLAGVVARTPAAPGTAPVGQLPHWLFAFDAAGIATYRALALLADHPDVLAAVRAEDPTEHRGLRPLARASVLEAVRLWPTTMVILRDGVQDTDWSGLRAAAGTGFAVASSFFHRDEENLPWADRFEPQIWLDGRAEASRALVPFSAGPARCPGRTLVLDLTSELLAAVVRDRGLTLDKPRNLATDGTLPRTLDHSGLRFRRG